MKSKIGFSIIAIVLILSPFWMSKLFDTWDTDEQTVAMIEKIEDGYTPWFNSLIEWSSDTTESLIFSLQIALGLGLIVWGFKKLKKSNF